MVSCGKFLATQQIEFHSSNARQANANTNGYAALSIIVVENLRIFMHASASATLALAWPRFVDWWIMIPALGFASFLWLQSIWTSHFSDIYRWFYGEWLSIAQSSIINFLRSNKTFNCYERILHVDVIQLDPQWIMRFEKFILLNVDALWTLINELIMHLLHIFSEILEESYCTCKYRWNLMMIL